MNPTVTGTTRTATVSTVDGGPAERGLVIASVPADHAYIRHLGPIGGDGPIRLPDPDPDDPRRSAQQRWWPPVMLNPDWVRGHAFDVVHVHFGFDSRSPQDLERFVEAVRRRSKPLVFTVHDLRNPHHPTRELHDAQLDVLISAADALLTLTPGAAREIRRRWGREAVVVPHPHVVDFAVMERAAACRARRRSDEFRVGLHVKTVRASMDPLIVLPVLIGAVADLPGAVLQVNAHQELVSPDGAHHDAGLARTLRSLAGLAHVDLRVHDYFNDEQFFCYLDRLDVSVLPYRFGTHSGWLEAGRDLDTTIVAPTCGFYAEQGPVLTYTMDEDRFEPESLAAAIRTAYDERPAFGATVEERRRGRQDIARVHDAVYADVLALAAR